MNRYVSILGLFIAVNTLCPKGCERFSIECLIAKRLMILDCDSRKMASKKVQCKVGVQCSVRSSTSNLANHVLIDLPLCTRVWFSWDRLGPFNSSDEKIVIPQRTMASYIIVCFFVWRGTTYGCDSQNIYIY